MNILRIAIKELKVFRDFKMAVFMLITPVVLILILGTAMSNMFNGSMAVGDIRVLYQDNSTPGSAIAKQWESFAREAGKSGILFEKAGGDKDGILEVQNSQYTGFTVIADSGLSYYGNNRSSVEGSIVQGMLAAFADRYKLAAEVAKADLKLPANPAQPGAGGGDYVQEASLDAAKQPGSLDYFAVAVTTLIILYSALSADHLIKSEKKRHTDIRLMASPITKAEILTGKIVGTFLLNFLFMIIVVLISKYVFDANWGDNMGLVILVLSTEIVFALGLGLGISYIIRGEASGAVIMIIIQIAAFVGGSYYPSEDSTGIFRTLSSYSPLQWTNDAILQLIYADHISASITAMLLNMGGAALLLTIAAVTMRRREGL
ncbi:ABC transporter permease [Paenibacillus mendelii]|uniref:ABC transporter permease n=1 Tax=Paenibacillus mendelii TaxID=206163 RepID=A0ABV6J2P1_9BACL|nr:ABC transporter permease [Paenibacillus mendelii]MCQ6559239.1 ABC transporter permease [Paenibacillus mendelii]